MIGREAEVAGTIRYGVQAMNAVYARMFGDHRPARTTIQAAGLPGPGLRVEIDCIAVLPVD